MAKEIERKYLVKSSEYRGIAITSCVIKQGYLSTRKEATVRVRVKDQSAYVTIKGVSNGAIRDEWEYPIPVNDAIEMLKLCQGNIIEKERFVVSYQGCAWEIDEFHGVHEGLVVAEIELTDDKETFPIPSFIGEEVTGNVNYYNSTLAGINPLK